jgi:serine/threonine-protein kinase/endoribonuclease IRE1
LKDNVTLATREVHLLQESDEHPNVIRYYFQEARSDFLYIALELCPASLADIIERPDNEQFLEITCGFDPKRALSQVTSGLRWLHGLKIVHRDIKPQNILVAFSKGGPSVSYSSTTMASNARSVKTKGAQFRMLISDFGLCKKLGADETSFLPTVDGAMAAGTVGWRAPEILRGEVKLDDLSVLANGEDSFGSRGSGVNGSGGATKGRTRLTKSVDVFALGCLFYYTLTSGGHPYGDRFEREVNILRNSKDLKGLEPFGEEGVEARDLIERMLLPDSASRYDRGW